MPIPASSDQYVQLKGGLALPVAPVLLALGLETRGFKLTREGEDIFISPASKLTDEDLRQLKLWKPHILALLDYEAPKVA